MTKNRELVAFNHQGRIMFNSTAQEEDKPKDQESLEEEKKKRQKYLKYNRGKFGIFGDKNEPELIERE